MVGNEVGVQDLLVASEDIATGIFWGLVITPFIEELLKYIILFFESLLEKKGLSLT